jgi:hypothetical protein
MEAAFGLRRPLRPRGRTSTPAFFRYRLTVSRRIPVSCSIRRSDQPRRPSASICCCFSRSKTFAMTRRLIAFVEVNVPDGSPSNGRFSGDH